jgi:phosphoadenosine phosphosulfate reductase
MDALDPTPGDLDLQRANDELRDASAEDVISWAAQRYGERLVVSTSFGATSAVMLHLVARVAPDTKVVCVDTGYLFPETYRFAAQLEERFGLDVRWATPAISASRQEALHGNRWEQGDEGVAEYLRINKVEPLDKLLGELGTEAWLAGLRANQTEHRASLPRVGVQNGRIKLHPILLWSEEDVDAYMERHDLPYHPLYAEGYRSIGDTHSTLPTTADMDPRDGRLLGKKKECGLHLPLTAAQNQSLKSSGL